MSDHQQFALVLGATREDARDYARENITREYYAFGKDECARLEGLRIDHCVIAPGTGTIPKATQYQVESLLDLVGGTYPTTGWLIEE